ncbi:hypothetical protein JCM19052_2147 [Vibrio sp. JCM 19052]|nr:hypothetical protein JCM19052_2147 [Vibrio sp. JCM 19052]
MTYLLVKSLRKYIAKRLGGFSFRLTIYFLFGLISHVQSILTEYSFFVVMSTI